jgi:hypothetical protein
VKNSSNIKDLDIYVSEIDIVNKTVHVYRCIAFYIYHLWKPNNFICVNNALHPSFFTKPQNFVYVHHIRVSSVVFHRTLVCAA